MVWIIDAAVRRAQESIAFHGGSSVDVGRCLLLVAAHDLPMNSIMNAFVKVEPRQIDLVVRVPQDLPRRRAFPGKRVLVRRRSVRVCGRARAGSP